MCFIEELPAVTFADLLKFIGQDAGSRVSSITSLNIMTQAKSLP
jgi:hypothetical protein